MTGPHRGLAGLLLAPLLLLAACATPVGVDHAGPDNVYAELRANAITRGIPSGTTRVILDRTDLWSTWNRRKPDALERLLDIAAKDTRRDTVFALAELHYLAAMDGWGEEHALASAAFAWTYLYDSDLGPLPEPWDPSAITAMDLYDRALVEALRKERGESILVVAGGERDLPRGTMAVALSEELPEPASGLSFIPADDFSIRGLRVRIRRPGLGVRLVAANPRREHRKLERGVFRGRPVFPATALLVPEGGLAALVKGRVSATLRLIDPAETRTFTVEGAPRPLGADFTAHIAWALQGSDIWSMETSAFFTGSYDIPPGLILLREKKGRIPVVFVHGTASSPGRWAEMINTLMADEEIATRIQPWVFVYPTGNPVGYSAAQLRESLADAVKEMDPDGTDPALHRMVLVGHSQGGLLCRMVASSSGRDPLLSTDGRPLDEMGFEPETRALIERCAFFDAAPEVSRCIFLATPHKGSFFAANWISRLLNSFITVTHKVQGAMAETFLGKEPEIRLPPGVDLPTAVDNMGPGSPFLLRYARMTKGPGVRFHSIVAVDGDGDPEDLDDGIVAYGSAHIEGAESEFIARSGHSCQEKPLVIEEVRRILLEHIREFDAATGVGAGDRGPSGAGSGVTPER